MSKVIYARAGDKWTKDKDGFLWLYREDTRTLIYETGIYPFRAERRQPDETDIPTPDAHALLQMWGYEVRGEATRPTHGVTYGVSSCDAMPNGTAIETRYSFPGGYKFDHDLTDHQIAQVREIVEEVLAEKAKPAPGEVVVHATPFPQRSKPAPATDDWRARCRVFQGKSGNHNWGVFSPSGKWYCSNITDKWLSFFPDAHDDYSRFTTESDARAALAKAPPPPDVSPEPNWRGLLAELVKAWDATYPLEAKLPESVLPFVNSPALSSARTKLAAKGGK